jgi:hypothetical protein
MEMNGNEKEKMGSWDGFLGSNFLSVEDVQDEKQPFVCVKVELDTENLRPMVIMQHNEITYKKSLNVTDAKFLHENKVASPNDLIGKKLFFRKTMAFSPSAKKDVQTLRISKVE